MQKPKPTLGLRHIALFSEKFAESVHFYTELLGMRITWRPDDDNIYLTSGYDNLALHKVNANFVAAPHQRLDHIGFIIASMEQVDAWHDYLKAQQVPIKTAPRTHRDGARSFYCLDPDGNTVQMIYIPELSSCA